MGKFLRGLVGFILTIILMVTVSVFCVIGTLRFSILNCSSLTEFVNDARLYESVSDVIIEEMVNNKDDIGLSENAIRTMFPEKLIIDSANTFTKALEKGEKIDLSYLKDDTTEYTEAVTEAMVEEIFDDLENRGELLSEDSLDEIKELNQFEEDYGINAKKAIIDKINEVYKSDKLDLSEKDKEKVRKDVHKALTKAVEPAINDAFNLYIDRMNEEANEAIDEMDDEIGLRELLKMFSFSMSAIKASVFILIAIILLLIGLEMLLYRSEIYRGFAHSGTALMVPGITTFFTSLGIYAGNELMLEEIDKDDPAEMAAANFVSYNLEKIFIAGMVIAVVIIVVAIVFKVIAHIKKKAYKKALAEARNNEQEDFQETYYKDSFESNYVSKTPYAPKPEVSYEFAGPKENKQENNDSTDVEQSPENVSQLDSDLQ